MDERTIFQKLMETKMRVMKEYPFFGRLLLRLRFGLAACKTAFTDMRRIVFDPDFVGRLTLDELAFVMLHEVLHCALQHCTRGEGKQDYVYNVACDIVVNSLILEMQGLEEKSVDGSPAMHLAPDGSEGRTKSAEEIYAMLMNQTSGDLLKMYGDGTAVDDHGAWKEIGDPTLEDLWRHHLKKAAVEGGAACGSVPGFMERYLKEISHHPRTNWRQILHDFIQFDRSDYLFSRPDRRFAGTDITLPSFCENVEGEAVEKILFAVDTSGSVSAEALSVSFHEICMAMEQIGNLKGFLSWFDAKVTEPVPFESVEDLLKTPPTGGGGTDFRGIFKMVEREFEADDLPAAIVILTDGYCSFPDEEETMGIPVIWIIVNSDVKPPWGVCTYIDL